MAGFELGLIIPTGATGPERTLQRWSDIKAIALAAEAMGFDTVWTPDELLWRPEGKPPMGMWEGVAMSAGLAAATTRIKIGTWVLSALHRNAGLTAKVAETIDEISGGRFIFGLGAGHAEPGQARAFGLPEEQIFDRFEEALQVIVPLLRGGHAEVEGAYHAARDLDQNPRGPRPGGIPLMLGVLGPRGMKLAAQHADIWSCYATARSDLVELGPRIAALEAACVEVGRDPATIGRSTSVDVKPFDAEPDPTGSALSGSPRQIADQVLALRDGGFTMVELWPTPFGLPAVEALAPVVELVREG